MDAINGIIFLNQAFDLNVRILKKFKLILKQISIQTGGKSFNYFTSSVDGKFKFQYFQKSPKEVWDEDLNTLEFNKDINFFISTNLGEENIKIYDSIFTLSLNLSKKENISEVIHKENDFFKAITKFQDCGPSIESNFNLVSFSKDKPNLFYFYRSLIPFYVAYNFDYQCLFFTTNRQDIKIISKENLLNFDRFLPLDLDPYSIYCIQQNKISFITQNIEMDEKLCCETLDQAIIEKLYIIDFEKQNLYDYKNNIFFSYCPFCGKSIQNLIEGN